MGIDRILSDPTADKAASLLDAFVTWLATSGLKIVFILVLAAVLRWVAAWLIRRFFRTMSSSGTALSSVAGVVVKRTEREAREAQTRREQRARTLSTVTVNIASLVIAVIAGIMVLDLCGVNVAPVIASLGVVGLAAGIGAQTIIKDFVAGTVMLFEDIVAVGDVVDLEYATGTVVNINLRTTQLRSLDGVLWTVRNGEIIRVGNMSRGYANAVVMLDISNRAKNATVTAALEKVVEQMWEDPEWHAIMIEKPQVSGILSVDGARFQRRIVAKVAPGSQWRAEQELRQRVRIAFEDAGIDFAMPRIIEPTP